VGDIVIIILHISISFSDLFTKDYDPLVGIDQTAGNKIPGRTFFARLILDKDGERLPMDCRPSDAIALALSFKAPIYVAEKVMDVAGQILDETLNASGGKGEAGAADRKI
jgi:hypothetical protein